MQFGQKWHYLSSEWHKIMIVEYPIVIVALKMQEIMREMANGGNNFWVYFHKHDHIKHVKHVLLDEMANGGNNFWVYFHEHDHIKHVKHVLLDEETEHRIFRASKPILHLSFMSCESESGDAFNDTLGSFWRIIQEIRAHLTNSPYISLELCSLMRNGITYRLSDSKSW